MLRGCCALQQKQSRVERDVDDALKVVREKARAKFDEVRAPVTEPRAAWWGDAGVVQRAALWDTCTIAFPRRYLL